MSVEAPPARQAIECLRSPLDRTTGAGARERPRRFYTSDLSVDEAILMKQAGFEVHGLVSGSSVYHVGFVTRSWSTNAEVPELSQAMYGARHAALTRLVEGSSSLADGVVGVRLQIQGFQGWSRGIQFVAIGTAVSDARRSSATHPRQFFTSDLSGKDLYLLHQAGYRPLGLVMGCCVYHVAHRSFGQWARSQRQNVEMQNVTEALYDARELAMGRMQEEALSYGADGVVGVSTSERPHVWGSNVIEFFAIGTAVALVGSDHRGVNPRMVMALDDPVVMTRPGGIVRSTS